MTSAPRPSLSSRAPKAESDGPLSMREPLLTRDESRAIASAPPDTGDAPALDVGDEFVDEASIVGEAAKLVGGTGEVAASSADPGAEAADEVREDELLVEDQRREGAPADETPHPTELDIPDFRRRSLGRGTVASLVGAALLLVVAGVTGRQFASGSEPSRASGGERPPARPAPEPAPELRRPVVSPPATAPAVSAAESAAPLQEAAGTSLEKAATPVVVTVKVVPEGAVIFRAGKRLGRGIVEVSVERNAKQRLTALHDGYLPSNFTLDGSRESVTVRLRYAPKPRAATPPSDSPYDAPSEDSTPATAPAATAAPVVESPTPAAPAGDGTPAAPEGDRSPGSDVSVPAEPGG